MIAARLLRELSGFAARVEIISYVEHARASIGLRAKRIDATDAVRALAASCLAQDETKGPRRKVRK